MLVLGTRAVPSTGTATASGVVGEYVSKQVLSGAAVALSTGTAKSVLSQDLTAGHWLVWGNINYILNGVTATLFASGVSTTADTLPAQAGLAQLPLLTTALTSTLSTVILPQRIEITVTTTMQLVSRGTFSLGTLTAYGDFFALRTD